MIDHRTWLALFCLSRMGFALINTVWAALIPLLRTEWGMGAAEAGAVQSAWHGGYLVSLVTASLLASRYGARRTFLAMGWAAAASTFLFALAADGYASAFLLYGFAGLCAGGSYIPGLTLIAERFPSAGRGRAMGAYIAAASLGYALGLAGAGALAGIAGARAGFLLAAGATLAGQLLALVTLRDTPNRPATGGGAILPSLPRLWRHRPSRTSILAYSFHAWELLGLWAWLPAFLGAAAALHGAGAGLSWGAGLAALAHLVSVGGSLAGGSASDRWGRAPAVLALALASAACSLAFGWLLASPLWVLALMAAVFNFAAIGDSAIHSAALTEIVAPRDLAAAYALRSVLGFGMGALSPWLFGAVLDHFSATPALGWGLAWSGLGAVALAGPWLVWRQWRKFDPAKKTLADQWL